MNYKIKNFFEIYKSPLARKFAFYLLFIELIIALFMSALTIYFNYQKEFRNLKQNIIKLEKMIIPSFRVNLWELNMNDLNILTDDLLHNKDIVYVRLTDEEGNILIQKGKIPKDDFIKREIPFYYNKTYIGKLVYYVTTKYIYEKHIHFIILSTVLIFVFLGIISLIVIFLYWNIIVKYLIKIKEYTNFLKTTGYKENKLTKLSLNRKPHHKKDEIDELVNSINNMHEVIVKKYKEIEYKSFHDELTGLSNRRMINEEIKNIIQKNNDPNKYNALLYIDLNNFKLINESMGHTTGDIILKTVSNRLKQICKNNCIPARLGGDQFLVLLKANSDKEETTQKALNLAKKILESISQPIKIDNQNFKISSSIGISVFGGPSRKLCKSRESCKIK